MLCKLVAAALILAAHCTALAGGAQSAVATYEDRGAFSAASAGLTTIDFEDLAPRSGFTNYKAPKTFTTAGVEFRPAGGGRFGPGFVSLAGAWYYAGPI